MARRYHEIKGLAEFTAKTIVSDEEQWKKFLHTAGHLYKLKKGIPAERFSRNFLEKKIFFTKKFDVTIDITSRRCYISVIR